MLGNRCQNSKVRADRKFDSELSQHKIQRSTHQAGLVIMCGIAGYWNIQSEGRCEFHEELASAVASLHHRGPDDSGLWLNAPGNVGLGHARLSILDLSQHAHQPMVSANERYVLVFNGEVYNFKEVREALEEKGFQFKGSGDSEVVLAAFQAWGHQCVDHFIGMFAFAVWDEQKQQISLFRDRVGVKPLYYSWDGKVFCFASELKALRSFQHWTPKINQQALGEFFQYSYIAAPRTIYQNVYKLLPAHCLKLRPGQEKPEVQQYWSVLNAVEKGSLGGNEDELSDQLEELLISAFRYRMVSDVPVGVFLSGGIDSSLVAAILQAHSGQSIHTYTLGFKEKSFDESTWAKKIAQHLGTKHTEYILDQDAALPVLPKLAEIYDEPFGDPSSLPTYLVAQLARQDVKVALSADGGDELFGGYAYYKGLPERLAMMQRIPYWLRKSSGALLSAIPVSALSFLASNTASFGAGKVFRYASQLSELLPNCNRSKLFSVSHSYWFPKEVSSLLNQYSDPYLHEREYPGGFEEQMMLWDIHHYHPDDILVKMDRASMAVGLEGREPLLDHRLLEFAYRLPLKYRLGELGSKHLLRKVLYRYVPREMIERPKQGFALPVNRWLQGSFGQAMREEILQLSEQAGLNSELVERELRASTKSGENAMRVWLLYIYTSWFRKWMM